ncbi:MAG: GNAT family N-acetyltransferase [Oceanococcus sp.]
MTESVNKPSFGDLFVQPAYLQALQQSGCAASACGWQSIPSGGDALYLKQHSWGEFVFDFEIAQAYEQSGLNYYPKLVCAVPFTPVVGPRLLGRSPQQLVALAQEHATSSVHVLFVNEQDRQSLSEQGWAQRQDIRYQWHNRDYASFDDFLAALQSKKRKNLRTERRAVAALNLDISWRAAADIRDEEWSQIFRLYARTYAVRGQEPYLNEACLRAWGAALPRAMQFCLARERDQIKAIAFYFCDGQALYGRHWGSAIDGEKLHFELCYYQGIEYCIKHGLQIFDAGVQGSHRVLRGFEPSLSHSMHMFLDPRFHTILDKAFARERAVLQQHFLQAQSHSAYRSESV